MRDDQNELMALHDGELSGQEASDAKDRQLDDPEARASLEKLARADKAFADAADDMLDMPVPSSLVDAIRQFEAPTQAQPGPETYAGTETEPKTAEVIPFPRRRGLVGLAIAAGLAAVVATNTPLFQLPGKPALDPEDAGYAALLQDVLESVPSGEVRSSVDGAVSVVPMLSFRTDAAAYCREFMKLQDGAEFSGVACRDGAGSWELVSQQRISTAAEGNDYRVAEGEAAETELPPTLTRAADLSYAEEQAAIQAGWQDSGR